MPPTNPLAWVQSAACQSAAAFSPDFRTTTSDCAHAVCSDAPHVDGFSFVPPPVAPKVRGVTFDTAGGGAFSRALASAFVTTADSLLVHRYRATCMPGPQTGAVPSRRIFAVWKDVPMQQSNSISPEIWASSRARAIVASSSRSVATLNFSPTHSGTIPLSFISFVKSDMP
eukprot:CAMPEP_0180260976 /NCGR_PEP_ID=MMETSP0987-20121128/43895_1 /TAXON_ID=697907 /ORGANISM="non described non described, Strain CCMP2293" /LENGTH=170 /DNA_ID=CAMNT_0022230895 /DNA_START=203 /DNA_END=711 /DNA_ORIENTATION=-